MEKENYIVIKELPDACVGTVVIWDESANCFYYEKNCWVSPHQKAYLTAGQVTQTPEYFCKAKEYPEYYAYKYPVFSREDILNLLEKHALTRSICYKFEVELRELGKTKAEQIIKWNRN